MKRLSRELMYVFGIIGIALGTVFMEQANFGMSMVVAPAYIFYLKLSEVWEFFTFGMAEYLLQAMLIIIMCLVLRRFKLCYLMAFVTAVLYGIVLDAFMTAAAQLGELGLPMRMVFYVLGLVTCALGVACMFKTYLMPEAYELLVKELAEKTGKDAGLVKTVYDCTSCAVAVALSFAFFGFGTFKGVHVGTIVCALINGRIISAISAWMDRRFEFVDSLPLRRFMK
jgi:uncharacterized membrane protein YczE